MGWYVSDTANFAICGFFFPFAPYVCDFFICCIGALLCLVGLIVAIILAILDHIGMKKMGLADVIHMESKNMVRAISVILCMRIDSLLCDVGIGWL